MTSTGIVKYCKEYDTKYQFGDKFFLTCETKIDENLSIVENDERSCRI